MSYEINIDLQAHDDIAALPTEALVPLAEALTFLQLTPWSTLPINDKNPDGAVRALPFGGAGLLTLDDQHRVDILKITWVR